MCIRDRAISDRVAILRKGEYIGAVETAKTNQAELTEMMVGRPVSLEIDRPKQERSIERLQVIDPVSYTHLDVYKRQSARQEGKRW